MKLSALLLCGIIVAAAALGAANEALKPGPVQPADIEQSILQPKDTEADPEPGSLSAMIGLDTSAFDDTASLVVQPRLTGR